jgi:hypothetical protein
MSGVPPGGKVTIILTGLFGKLWAKTVEVMDKTKVTKANPERSRFKELFVFRLNIFISAPWMIGFWFYLIDYLNTAVKVRHKNVGSEFEVNVESIF